MVRITRRTLGQIVEVGQEDSVKSHIFLDSKNRPYEFIAYASDSKSIVLGHIARDGLHVLKGLLNEHSDDPENWDKYFSLF